ncbi:MAG: glycoside hydrolase family 3 N-terminal domain-containing protein [Myxococcaceae bacterium]
MTRRPGLTFLVLLVCACVSGPTVVPDEARPHLDDPPLGVDALPPTVPVVPAAAAPRTGAPDVDELLSKMTVEEKVGQLMMVGFGGKSVDAAITDLVRGYRVGGVCVFGRNIASASQTAKLNDDVRALLADGIPPFIAVDQEGGNVVRVSDGNLVLPGNMVLGAARQPELAYEAGRAQGEDLRRLGFNMNLAPVLDVNSNPQNPVIGVRAFGDDVQLVSDLGASFVRGQQDARIISVAKHFPGHGAVDGDSHKTLPIVRAPLRQVRAQLRPFEAAMKAGLDGLMTAHIATPALTGDEVPATLSKRVLGGVLRDELGFDGLVITDELEMDAIDRHYGVGHAAVLAVNAGADMVLIPWRLEKKEEVYLALLDAARSGEISRQRLDRSVRRILTTKLHGGVFEPLPPLDERLAHLGEKKDLALRIASAGVTLIRSEAQLFPIKKPRKVVVISAEKGLVTALEKRLPSMVSFVVPAIPSPTSRDDLKRQARALAENADLVVVGVVNSRQLELVTNAALAGKPVVAVVLGAPYLASQAHQAKVVLTTYSNRDAATEAAAAALLGERGTPGKLPVSLPRLPFGFGLDPVGSTTATVGSAKTSGAAERSAASLGPLN